MNVIDTSYLSKDTAAPRLARLNQEWQEEAVPMDDVSAGFIVDVLTAVGYSDQEIAAIFPEAFGLALGLIEPCIPR